MPLYNPTAQPVTLFRTPVAAPPPRARVLFVHGAWHGAWFWERWQRLFADRGIESFAVDLPGHGTRAGDGWAWHAGIGDFVECVRDAVEEIGDVILVGHSMGAFTVLKYLEQYEAPAAVLLAPVPYTGSPIGNVVRLAKLNASVAVRLLLSMPVPLKDEAVVREVFFSDDVDKATVRHTTAHLSRESARALMQLTLTMRGKPKAVRTKVLVAGAERDWLFPVEAAKALADALPNGEWLFLEGTAHDAALDTRWKEAGTRVCDWVESVSSSSTAPELAPPPGWKHARSPRLVPRPGTPAAPALPSGPPLTRPLIHRPEPKA